MKTDNFIRIGDQYYAKGTKEAKAYAQSMAGLRDTERQPDALPALGSGAKAHRGRKSRVDFCIKIVSYRKRQADLDNIIAGAKPLRDAISRSLAIDDGSPRLRWEYDTIVTTGAVGTQVMISKL